MNTPTRLRWLTLILLAEASLSAVMFSAPARDRAALRKPATVQRSLAGENFTVLEEYRFVNDASLAAWEEKVFKGKSAFRVLSEGGNGYLNTVTKDACSGLYVKINHTVEPSLYLSWRWRAKHFPKKISPEKLANKKEDDFAARVYAIFPGSTFFRSDVMEYLWDETQAPGTAVESPYSNRIQLVVLRSGPPGAENGGWVNEERNIYDDYVKLFGRPPTRALGAVALMSDSDNTGAESEADFADIQIKTKIGTAKEKGGQP